MDVEAFAEHVGVSFRDISILKQAFTHRSYLNEHRTSPVAHNERLEFLGDAILELVVTEYLFKKFPAKNEGELTAYRSALVNTNTLSMVADSLEMNKYLLLSRGERKDTGRARQFILANTFEAVVGAMYLDAGFDTVSKFIATFLLTYTDTVIENRLWQDAKSRFQEVAQEKASITPTYSLVEETGPDHDKQFTVAVCLHNEKIAEGAGKSKQEAEQDAARNALDAKGW